jgi:hypothetical protein
MIMISLVNLCVCMVYTSIYVMYIPVAHLVTSVPYYCRLSCNIVKYEREYRVRGYVHPMLLI